MAELSLGLRGSRRLARPGEAPVQGVRVGDRTSFRDDAVLPVSSASSTDCVGRLSASRGGTVTTVEAIVRQEDRSPSNGATEGGLSSLLPNA